MRMSEIYVELLYETGEIGMEGKEAMKKSLPRMLPVFRGYTVDMRLREFRKPDLTGAIPFDSTEGNSVLEEMKKGWFGHIRMDPNRNSLNRSGFPDVPGRK